MGSALGSGTVQHEQPTRAGRYPILVACSPTWAALHGGAQSNVGGPPGQHAVQDGWPTQRGPPGCGLVHHGRPTRLGSSPSWVAHRTGRSPSWLPHKGGVVILGLPITTTHWGEARSNIDSQPGCGAVHHGRFTGGGAWSSMGSSPRWGAVHHAWPTKEGCCPSRAAHWEGHGPLWVAHGARRNPLGLPTGAGMVLRAQCTGVGCGRTWVVQWGGAQSTMGGPPVRGVVHHGWLTRVRHSAPWVAQRCWLRSIMGGPPGWGAAHRGRVCSNMGPSPGWSVPPGRGTVHHGLTTGVGYGYIMGSPPRWCLVHRDPQYRHPIAFFPCKGGAKKFDTNLKDLKIMIFLDTSQRL